MEQLYDRKRIKLKLNQEEKNVFFDFINMLPKGIYDKSKESDSLFLKAMEEGDIQTAFDFLQQLSWNRIALKILTYAKKHKSYSNSDSNKIIIQDFNSFVASQYSNLSQCKIIMCPNCGMPISTEDKVCPYCGCLTEE